MQEVAFFDFDDTIIAGQTSKMFVRYLVLKKKISLLTFIKFFSWYLLYRLNIIKDVEPMMKKAFRIVKGWTLEETDLLLKDFFEKEVKENFYPEIIEIVKYHKSQGRKIAIISNNIKMLVDEVSSYVGADFAFGTNLEIVDGLYTGKINGSPLYSSEKAELIKRMAKKETWNLAKSWAYSDHYSDIYMLNLVGNPVAVNPEPILRQHAEKNSWKILKLKK